MFGFWSDKMTISNHLIASYLLIAAFSISSSVQWNDDYRYKYPGLYPELDRDSDFNGNQNSRSIYNNEDWDERGYKNRNPVPGKSIMSKFGYNGPNGKYGYANKYKSPTASGSFGRSPVPYSKSHLNYDSPPAAAKSPFNSGRPIGYKSTFPSPSFGRTTSVGHKSPVPYEYQDKATIPPKSFNDFDANRAPRNAVSFNSRGQNADIVAALDRLAARLR